MTCKKGGKMFEEVRSESGFGQQSRDDQSADHYAALSAPNENSPCHAPQGVEASASPELEKPAPNAPNPIERALEAVTPSAALHEEFQEDPPPDPNRAQEPLWIPP